MPKKQDPSKSMKSLLEIDALKNFMKRDKEFSPKEKKSYQPIDTRTVKDAKSMDSEDMIDMIANAIEDLSEDNIRNISSDTLKTIYLISSIERAIQNGGLEKFYDREP